MIKYLQFQQPLIYQELYNKLQDLILQILENILLLNPTDIYRLLNLTGFENTAMYSGMAGVSGQIGLSKTALLAAQLGWIAIPFALAAWLFARRPI